MLYNPWRAVIQLIGSLIILAVIDWRLLVGSLESLWLTHVRTWAETSTEAGAVPDRAYRAKGLETHERLTGLIERGDVPAVTVLAESHFDPEQFYLTAADAGRRVDSASMRSAVGGVVSGPYRQPV